MSDHILSVFGFHLFFLFCFLLAWITKPKKNRRIAVGECLRPNASRKAGTVRAGDIMTGGIMCDQYDDAGLLIRPDIKIEN